MRSLVAPRQWLLVGVLVLPCVLRQSRVRAEPAPLPSARYEADVDTALSEYERGNFEESREYFRRAHAERPSARTMRGLGKVEFELRNYVEARRWLDAALASQVNALDDALRTEVEALVARTNTYLGELQLSVDPPSASIRVDQVLVGTGPRATLVLMVGDHVLDVRDTGRIPERRSLRVHGGERGTLHVALAVPSAPAPLLPTGHDGLTRKAWFGIAAGVVLAVAASVGVGVALARRNADDGHTLSGGSTGLVLVNR